MTNKFGNYNGIGLGLGMFLCTLVVLAFVLGVAFGARHQRRMEQARLAQPIQISGAAQPEQLAQPSLHLSPARGATVRGAGQPILCDAGDLVKLLLYVSSDRGDVHVQYTVERTIRCPSEKELSQQ
jgi:hypothetical protein